MPDGSRELPSEHHVQLGIAEHERVGSIDEHRVRGLAQRARE
jgi:hypothetical protein